MEGFLKQHWARLRPDWSGAEDPDACAALPPLWDYADDSRPAGGGGGGGEHHKEASRKAMKRAGSMMKVHGAEAAKGADAAEAASGRFKASRRPRPMM